MTEKRAVETYLQQTGLKLYQLADLARVPRKSMYRFMSGDQDLKLGQWKRLEKLIDRKPE